MASLSDPTSVNECTDDEWAEIFEGTDVYVTETKTTSATNAVNDTTAQTPAADVNASARASWTPELLKQFEEHHDCAEGWVKRIQDAVVSLDLLSVSEHDWGAVNFASLIVKKLENPTEIWQINPITDARTGLGVTNRRSTYSTMGCTGYVSELVLMYENEVVKVLLSGSLCKKPQLEVLANGQIIVKQPLTWED